MTARYLLMTTAAATLALSACTQFPELDATVTPVAESADYPALVPAETLLAQADTGARNPRQIEANLNARVANLRARAARLRGSVLSGAARQRLREGLR